MFQHQRNKFIFKISYASLLLFSTIAYGLNTDKNQPAHLNANSVQYNQNTGVGIYSGNVSITQGTTIVKANQITTYSDKQNQLQKAVATGTPASYQTEPQVNQPLLTAEASTITYFPTQQTVILQGNASVTQNNNVLNSPWISYNMKTGQIITHSDPSTKQRTTIIYQPKPQAQ